MSSMEGTLTGFGAACILAGLVAGGLKRVVHVSSVAVYDAGMPRDATEEYLQLTERSRRTPFNAYQISKALSEQLAWRLAARHDLQLTTVRPCTIYGAFAP